MKESEYTKEMLWNIIRAEYEVIILQARLLGFESSDKETTANKGDETK